MGFWGCFEAPVGLCPEKVSSEEYRGFFFGGGRVPIC